MRPFFAVFLMLTASAHASGQPGTRGALASGPTIYAGGGIGPGIGVVAIGSDPVLGVLTREIVLYADYVPRVVGGSGRLLTAVGIGGGVRVTRIASIIQNLEPGPLELDAGIRIGPSFYTAFFSQTAESEAKAFAIFVDPFARGTLRVAGRRAVFAEVGLQAPKLRGGLALTLRR